MKNGQITISWILGLGATLILSAFGSMAVADRLSQDRDYDQIQRIARLEEQTKRIPVIEGKIDLLLSKIGVNAKELKEVEKLSISVGK